MNVWMGIAELRDIQSVVSLPFNSGSGYLKYPTVIREKAL